MGAGSARRHLFVWISLCCAASEPLSSVGRNLISVERDLVSLGRSLLSVERHGGEDALAEETAPDAELVAQVLVVNQR